MENGGWVGVVNDGNLGNIVIGSQGTVDASGGTLEGNITVESGGTLDPSDVTTIIGNLTADNGSNTALDVLGRGAGDYGQLDVTGDVDLNGTIDIDFGSGVDPYVGETFDFINSGTENIIETPGFNIVVTGLGTGTGHSYFNPQTGSFDYVIDTTPEAGTWILLAIALAGLAGLAGRKKRTVLPDLTI